MKMECSQLTHNVNCDELINTWENDINYDKIGAVYEFSCEEKAKQDKTHEQ